MNFDGTPDDTMGKQKYFPPSVLHVLRLFMVKFLPSATSTAGFRLIAWEILGDLGSPDSLAHHKAHFIKDKNLNVGIRQ